MLLGTFPLSAAPQATLAAILAGRTVTLWGASASALGLSVATRVTQQGRQVRWICGDNRFDPYHVVQEAETLGLPAEFALGQIQIARAFTAYQLTELVARLQPEADTRLVIISGLCNTFLDEDVPLNDAVRLFYRTLWRTVRLTAEEMSLLVIQPPIAQKTRRSYFLEDLRRISHRVLEVSGKETCTLRSKLRPGLVGLAQWDQRIEGSHDGPNGSHLYTNARPLPAALEQSAPRPTQSGPGGI